MEIFFTVKTGFLFAFKEKQKKILNDNNNVLMEKSTSVKILEMLCFGGFGFQLRPPWVTAWGRGIDLAPCVPNFLILEGSAGTLAGDAFYATMF